MDSELPYINESFFFGGQQNLRTPPPNSKHFLKEFQRNFINEIPNVFEGYIKKKHFIFSRLSQSLNFLKESPNVFEGYIKTKKHFTLLRFSQSLNFIKEIPNVFEGYIKNPPLHFIKVFPVIEFY